MKKKLLGGLLVVAIAAVAAFNVNMNTEKNELSALALANVEALASGEYESGIWGTNWKSYTVTCATTSTPDVVIHLGPLGDWGWTTGDSWTATFQGTKCGYGTGSCFSGDC